MISYLSGKLIEKNPTDIIVECNGIGYFLNISLHTYSLLTSDENIKIFTHLQVKEDSHTLYGFVEKSERAIFRLLLSVSGVGASTARTMLSSLSPKQITNAIASDDVSTIQSAKGIGSKTAQRIILDLKEKVLKLYDIDEVYVNKYNKNRDEALSALDVLGFTRKTTEKIVEKIIQETPEISVEFIIKKALKNL